MTAGEETSNNGWVHWIAVICFLEWGLIHIVAGVGTLYFAHKPDIPSLLIFICQGAPEAVQAEAKEMTSWSPLNIRILAELVMGWCVVNRASVGNCIFGNNSSTHVCDGTLAVLCRCGVLLCN